jgi:hypothetical protein
MLLNILKKLLRQLSQLSGASHRPTVNPAVPIYEEALHLLKPKRVAGGFSPPAPTPPGVRVRTGRFPEHAEPWPGVQCARTVL